MEEWSVGVRSIGGSAYWEEWGFDATNRERNKLCLFPVLHHCNIPTSFGFVPSVHLLITRAHSRSPKSFQDLSPDGWRNDSGDCRYLLSGGSRRVCFLRWALWLRQDHFAHVHRRPDRFHDRKNRREGPRDQRPTAEPGPGIPGVQ